MIPGDDQFTYTEKLEELLHLLMMHLVDKTGNNLANRIQNLFLKKFAQTMFKPGSRGYMQLFLFAPDWTISNIRIIAKSYLYLSLIQHYVEYINTILQSSINICNSRNLLNYIFSGQSILENTDPTRIDLGMDKYLHFLNN